MAQLRQNYDQFEHENTIILVIGPENAEKFAKYWKENNLPFIGLPDPKHKILKLYGQQIKIFKYGRMPAMAVIDKESIVRFVHYGNSMTDIPKNEDVITTLKELNQKEILAKQGTQ